MAKENRYDSYELVPPDIGLWETASPVDDSIEAFQTVINMTLTERRTLRTRGGFSTKVGDTIAGGHVRKLWNYDTFSPASTTIYSYLIASVEDLTTGRFSLKWLLAGGVSWTTVTALRDCNNSTRVHTLSISRGLAYVKGFPPSTGDKLGTIILDGTSGTILTKPWGLLGPTVPAKVSGQVTKLTADVTATATTLNVTSTAAFPAAPFTLWVGTEKMTCTVKAATTFTVTRAVSGTPAEAHKALTAVFYYDWGASDHQVAVKFGWTYAYAYKSITGHISNRSDTQKNPDLMPSQTGAFLDLVPKIFIEGHADTTNVPKIVIYRNSDGGDAFHLLEEITNTGAGTITYYDDSFGTGATSTTFNDPVPNTELTSRAFAPSLVSNSPPPTVVPPEVIGTDPVSPNCYGMTTHIRRIFYNVGNYLYFSSSEETLAGIPEEAFVTEQLADGGSNFIAFNDVITALVSDNESLWIFTTKNIYRLYGFTKSSFYVTKMYDVGARITKYNNAAASSNGRIAFIAQNGSVQLITQNGNRMDRISDPISLSGSNALTVLTQDIGVVFYKNSYQELLMLYQCAFPSSTTRDVYVYDVLRSEQKNRPVWISAWSFVGTPVAFASLESSSAEFTGLFYANGNTTDSVVGKYQESTLIAPTDIKADSTTEGFVNTIFTMPIRVPTGNNVNTFNRPTRDVKSTRLFIYHYPVGGEFVAPSCTFTPDNTGVGYAMETSEPPRIDYATPGDYTISVWAIDKDLYRVRYTIGGTTGKYMELYGIVSEFLPQYTATVV